MKKLSKDLAKCPNLKTVRLDHNGLHVESFPEEFLADSQVSLLSIEGNPIDPKKFQEAPGYDKVFELDDEFENKNNQWLTVKLCLTLSVHGALHSDKKETYMNSQLLEKFYSPK